MSYKKSNWVPYDPTLSFEQNVTQGGTTTADKLNNMETGIGNAFDKTSDTIGGRNLLPGTSGTLQTVTNASWHNYNLPSITPVVTTVDSDTTYTARAWLSPASHDMQVQVVWTDSSGTTYYGGGNTISAGTSGYSTWAGTFTAGTTIQRVTIIFIAEQTTASTVSYKEMKLEKGSIATDWTPAPEDKVNVTDMRKPASDVVGIEEVNTKQDKIGYTPADDSKVVHSTDMRKPASDVAGLEDITTAYNQGGIADGTDAQSITKEGLYQLNGSHLINFIDSGRWWGTIQVINQGGAILQIARVAQADIYTNSYAGSPVHWNGWTKLADDSKVAHLSGANNFDTVPTVNNKPMATTDDVSNASNTVLTSANTSISKLLQSSSNNDEDSAVTNSTSDTSNFYYWTE